MDLLKNVTNTHKKIESIQKRIFNVVMREPIDPDPHYKWEETFGVFNEKTGKLLGRVGTRYSVTQPKAVFDAFCDAILKYKLDPETLKYTIVKGGQIVRFSIKIKDIEFTNKVGKKDKTALFLVLQVGLNGKIKTSMYVYSVRKICTNGAVANFTEFEVAFKNVKGNQGKIVAMFDEVAKTIKKAKELEKLYAKLNNVEIDQAVINLYLKRVHDIDMEKYGEYHPNKQEVIDLINNSIMLEIGRTGSTLFGLYNGTTHYANHVINSEDTDSVFTGVGSRLIVKAENAIFDLLKQVKPNTNKLVLAD